MLKQLQQWLARPNAAKNKTDLNKKLRSACSNGLLLITGLLLANTYSQAQATYQIGSGVSTTTNLPINSCFAYNYSQQIYTASEILATGVAGSQTISKIRFYYDGGGGNFANWTNFTIFLGNTAQADFATTTSWVPASGLSQVYSGSFTATPGTWAEFVLDSAFVWDGVSNLVIAIDENLPGWSCSARWRSYPGAAATTGMSFYSDDSNPDPTNPPAANETNGTDFAKPQLQLEMTSTVPCTGTPAPGNTTASANPACPGVPFVLGTQFPANGYGVTYQWQSSPDSLTWTNIGTNTHTHETSLTANTYYRVISTCTISGDSAVSTPALVEVSTFINCYCASGATNFSGLDIGRVEFGNLQNGTATPIVNNPAANNTYSDFSALAPATFYKGLSYPINLHTITSASDLDPVLYNVFIDYNHDGIFDPNDERVFTSPPFFFGNQVSGNIQISDSALTGNTRMRVMMVFFNVEGPTYNQPCGDYWEGETEDYILNILPLPVCSSTPFAGNLPDSVGACVATTLTLTATNTDQATGLIYQWEQSDNGGTTWANVTGGENANTTSYTTDSVTTAMAGRLYRLRVTCTLSGLSSATAPVAVYLAPANQCYCQSDYADGTGDGDYIGRVSLGSIHNITTGAPAPYYTFYSNLSTDLSVLGTYTLTLSPGTYNEGNVQAAWIDFNQNGQFEATEKLGEVTFADAYPDSSTITFTVPAGTALGTTRLRVVHVYSGENIEPCGMYGYGETEDYLVNIMGLSGAYTINQTQPASATNFTSFTSAAGFLNTVGISDSVTIEVVSGTGPYQNQQFQLGQIPGASASNTITINGNGNTLSLCSSNPLSRDLIRLDGTDHITINGLVLNAPCGNGWGVHLMNGNENVTIANNTITLNPAYSIYGANLQGIVASNSWNAPGAEAGLLSNITLTGNTIQNGYHGIIINGNSAAWANNLVIANNTLTNTVAFGIVANRTNGLQVSGNTISMKNVDPAQDIHSIGIQLNQAENGFAVTGNKVANAGKQAMFLNYVNQNSTTRGLVANNMLGGGFRFSSPIGLQLNFASYLDVYYNSVNTDFGATGTGFYVSNNRSNELQVLNNSFAYTGTGADGRAMSANNANTNFTLLDNNNYYSTGGRFVFFNVNWRNDLASLQSSLEYGTILHDQSSWAVNPLYVSATDLHLQAGSPLAAKALPIAGVTTDYDGNLRSATAPTIGADELGVGPVRLAPATVSASVYPNPFVDELSLKLENAEGNVRVVMVDMMGREVYSNNFTATSNPVIIHPTKLAQGVYLLQVTNNGVATQFRVVKQ